MLTFGLAREAFQKVWPVIRDIGDALNDGDSVTVNSDSNEAGQTGPNDGMSRAIIQQKLVDPLPEINRNNLKDSLINLYLENYKILNGKEAQVSLTDFMSAFLNFGSTEKLEAIANVVYQNTGEQQAALEFKNKLDCYHKKSVSLHATDEEMSGGYGSTETIFAVTEEKSPDIYNLQESIDSIKQIDSKNLTKKLLDLYRKYKEILCQRSGITYSIKHFLQLFTYQEGQQKQNVLDEMLPGALERNNADAKIVKAFNRELKLYLGRAAELHKNKQHGSRHIIKYDEYENVNPLEL